MLGLWLAIEKDPFDVIARPVEAWNSALHDGKDRGVEEAADDLRITRRRGRRRSTEKLLLDRLGEICERRDFHVPDPGGRAVDLCYVRSSGMNDLVVEA